MAISFDRVFGIHDDALLLRSQRADVLARNLANADTPGYKARDMDFQAELRRAEQGGPGTESVRLRTTHAAHIQESRAEWGDTELMYRVPLQPAIDGNTVDTQTEQAAFTRNAIAYQASLRFVSGKIQGLMRAIRGE